MLRYSKHFQQSLANYHNRFLYNVRLCGQFFKDLIRNTGLEKPQEIRLLNTLQTIILDAEISHDEAFTSCINH